MNFFSEKIFVKDVTSGQRFIQEPGGLPIPLSPAITHWGTWRETTAYYAKKYELIKYVSSKFSADDAKHIKEAQDVLNMK
jgi:hypothetical protein